MCMSTHNHTYVPMFGLYYGLRVTKTEKKKKKKKGQNSSKFACCLLEGRPKSQEPTLPSQAVPGAILHTDPRSFTSNTKHPVSANQAEVLVSPANERVWCQRAVLWPGSPSVWRIYEDESHMRLKVLDLPVSPIVLGGNKKKKRNKK